MMTKIREQEKAQSCLTRSDCDRFAELREYVVKSLGSATAQAAAIAGNKKAQENGTCTAYEIFNAFEETIGPETAKKMFGNGYCKSCQYDFSQFI